MVKSVDVTTSGQDGSMVVGVIGTQTDCDVTCANDVSVKRTSISVPVLPREDWRSIEPVAGEA